MAAPGMRRVVAQIWGPDPGTVAAVGALDTMHGLALAGISDPMAVRGGMNMGFAGDLGPLQAFAPVGNAPTANMRAGSDSAGLPGTYGASGVSTVQAALLAPGTL